MKILIVGSGGREHAIAAAVAKSPKADKIYCAPGNAGIGQIAECVPIGAMEFDKLVAFAKEKAIDLTIVGMDDPLVGGLVDEIRARASSRAAATSSISTHRAMAGRRAWNFSATPSRKCGSSTPRASAPCAMWKS